MEFLPDQPLPTEAIHNVYELKTQPKLVRYHHAVAGYPTEPTWIKAIKNKQLASWPGLTVEAVQIYYPELEETHKGHGQKTWSGLQSTKQKQVRDKEKIEFTDHVQQSRAEKYTFASHAYSKKQPASCQLIKPDDFPRIHNGGMNT